MILWLFQRNFNIYRVYRHGTEFPELSDIVIDDYPNAGVFELENEPWVMSVSCPDCL